MLLEALVAQALHKIFFHLAQSSAQQHWIILALIGYDRAAAVQLDLRAQQTRGAENAGTRRYDDTSDPQRTPDFGSMYRPRPSESHQHEILRVAPALDRDGLDGANHVGYRHDMYAVSGLVQRQSGGAGALAE